MIGTKHVLSLIAFIIATIHVVAQPKPLIEIFLVDKVTYVDTLENGNGSYFSCTSKDLPNDSFINNNEITGYEVPVDSLKSSTRRSMYFLHINKSGQEKLKNLEEIALCCGRRFVIAVNRQPVYGGYFWNAISSFGCSWLSIPVVNTGRLPIERGLPFEYFNTEHGDPRDNKLLIEAFRQTHRLRMAAL